MSVDLNGTNEYLNREATIGGLPLTISCWFKTNSTTTAQTIWADSVKASSGQRYSFFIDTDSKLKASTVASGIFNSAASSASVTTNWEHGVAIFTSSSSRAVFLNGTKATNTVTAAPSGTRNVMTVGARWDSSVAGVYFNGLIAEMTIWNVTLDDAEVLSLSRGVPVRHVRPGSILAHYPLGGFYGDNALDFSSGGRNLTEVNTPNWSDHPNLWFPQPFSFIDSSQASKLWLNVGGTWKETTPHIKVSGTWKTATPFIKNSGVWK